MATASYLLTLDQGTTSSRAIVFNSKGRLVASAQRELRQFYPKPGWVEQDPEEIWESQLYSLREAVHQAGISPESIAGIGICNQRETLVAWDRRNGKSLARAIVWQCRRSQDICQALALDGREALITSKTGLLLDPYFTASKAAWLLDNNEELRSLADSGQLCLGTVDSWLLYKLCGRHLCDRTNASRTMLFNIHTLDWDEELLNLFSIPRACLPEALPCIADFGFCHHDILGVQIPIRASVGDQQASLFGHCCFSEGELKTTYGTGCFSLMNVGTSPIPSRNRLLTTLAWDLGDKHPFYALEGSVFIGGAVIQWLRDELSMLSTASESEAMAFSVPDSGGIFMVPAFVGLGAPYWDPSARGAILGLSRGTNSAHFVRAALESIAFQCHDLMQAMEKDAAIPIANVKADGGGSSNAFLMSFQSDILQKNVIVPEIKETTALGCAYMAGLGCGFWNGLDELRANSPYGLEFKPNMSSPIRDNLLRRWAQAVRAVRMF